MHYEMLIDDIMLIYSDTSCCLRMFG